MTRSELDVLLGRVLDPVLRADLKALIDRIQPRRTYGLVFESHLPERVYLPDHTVRRGLKVISRNQVNSPTFDVLAIRDDHATVRKIRNPDGSNLDPAAAAEAVKDAVSIESLIVIADFGVRDPKATFLWVTDDPALNRQTRARMLAASDLLTSGRLVVLDDDFLDDQLSQGHVYFLNVQKLSKTSRLARSASNLRQLSMWDVLANTITSGRTDLYLVLDEAHRGMKQATDRKTIVHRIISGQPGSNPAMPVVWGISATIDRFTKAMDGVVNRTNYQHVAVDIQDVRASGLIKDHIGLDQPNELGTYSNTLLREAAKAILDFDRRWAAYCTIEDEPLVAPILVIQVPDKVTQAKLAEIVAVVEHEWPGLGPHAIVHVFGEHEPVEASTRTVEWVHSESIQAEAYVRVVLAKEAISTGWDCPRAEVLYSERPAKDLTHIAQVIGRMVRQPLVHRIATDDALNSVSCFLPLFDREALGAIKDELEGRGKRNGENQLGPDVVRSPEVFERNPNLGAEVFDLIETLPSIPTPSRLANPLRRAKNLVRLLADDATGKALVPDAGQVLTKTLNAKLDGFAAEYAEAVATKVRDIETTDIVTTIIGTTGQDASTSYRTAETHAQDIDRAARRVINSVKEGVGKDYYTYRVNRAGSRVDRLQVRTEVAALLMVDGVVGAIEAAATTFVQEHLAQFAVEIKNTTGSLRDAYRRVEEQTSQLEVGAIELRTNVKTATRDMTGNPLPYFVGHLFSDTKGRFPIRFRSDWETSVVETEIARPSFIGWYRNPSQATPNALRIAYQDDAEKWVPLLVDFIVVSRRDDGTLAASIVDPHGDYLADAKAKLRALAKFAEDHGDRFLRIDSVAKVGDGTLRVLDLHSAAVRKAVRSFEGGKVTVLYESDTASDYG